jgi:N-acetylglucosamine-6-phosphate deacetylase
MKLLIKNAKVITPYEILNNQNVIVEDGKIVDINSDEVSSESFLEVIDAKSNYLSPGFIDIHNHGNSGYDFMDANFEAFDEISKFHLKNGITSYLLTTITSKHEDLVNVLNTGSAYIESSMRYSNMVGIYLEGPYFSKEKKGAQPERYLKNPTIEEIDEFIKASGNNLTVVSIAPEMENSLDAIRYLNEKGIKVAMGHTNSTYDIAKKAIDAGASIATHLYNGMRAFSHREPGIIGASLTDERVRCEIIADMIHIHKAAIELAIDVKGFDSIILISDAMMAAGKPDGEYTLGGQDVFVKEGKAVLKDGTIAGSTLTLNKAVYNLVNHLGIKLNDAVRMASLSSARAIGIGDKKGSIEIGKDADMIIFDEKLNILNTIVNGEIRYYKDI